MINMAGCPLGIGHRSKESGEKKKKRGRERDSCFVMIPLV